MNVALKAMLDPGDEAIVLVPYFPEYRFYIENHGGRVVPVETDEAFQPDPDRIAAAITPRTKALVVNSPNNPTGAVYSEQALAKLGALAAVWPDLTVLSDEPYRALVFDGREAPALRGDGLVVAVRLVDLPVHRLDGIEPIGGVEHLRSTVDRGFELRSC